MIFQVTDDCLRLGLRSGAIVFRDVQVTERKSALQAEITEAVQAIRARFPDPQAIRATPEVIGFQEILGKIGIQSRKVQPSVERLLSLVLKRGDLPAINSLVDAYNLISIRSLCSLGAHDLDRITAPVSLRMLTGQETLISLGKDTKQPVKPGEFGYVDAANRVLCWLDVLQADFSKVTAATVNALLIIEGTHVHSPQVLRQTYSDAIDLIQRHCGGSAEIIAGPEP